MSSPSLTSLGRYQIVRTLARGAMGVVYEAVDARLGRTVAIKTVLKAHLDDEATAHQFAQRFEREAQAAARMSHPNIVTVYDFGEHDGELSYIVMEYVRGRELASLFKGGQAFTLAEAARIVGQLLDALAYAHERGVVHRDVKPANVLIDEAGQVKLADFGVARMAEGTLDRTMPGTIVGTPNYMAPEQILGQSVGSRADLFATGVLLYQCLTGVQPFAGGGMFEVQRRILQDEPPPPSTLRPELPAAMDAVVARALAKQPDARYDSAASFAADLRRVVAAAAPTKGVAASAVDDDATVLRTRPAPGAWDPTLPYAPTSAAAATGGRTGPPSLPGTSPSRSGTLPSQPGTRPTQAGATSSLPGTTPSQAGRPSTSTTPATAGLATRPSAAAEDAGRAAPAGAATAPPARTSRRAVSPTLLALLALGAAGAAITWWALRPQDAATGDSAPSVTAPTPSPAPPPVVVAPPPAPTPAPVEAARPGVDSAPVAVPGSAVRTPTLAPAPAPPAPEPAAAPAPEPRLPPARATPSTSPRPAPPRAAAPAPAPAARCAELLERMQLGEPLTPDQSTYFQSRCTR